MFDAVDCPNCSESIAYREEWHPLTYIERAADDHSPKSLVVIANNRLLHMCRIDDDDNDLPDDGQKAAQPEPFGPTRHPLTARTMRI